MSDSVTDTSPNDGQAATRPAALQRLIENAGFPTVPVWRNKGSQRKRDAYARANGMRCMVAFSDGTASCYTCFKTHDEFRSALYNACLYCSSAECPDKERGDCQFYEQLYTKVNWYIDVDQKASEHSDTVLHVVLDACKERKLGAPKVLIGSRLKKKMNDEGSIEEHFYNSYHVTFPRKAAAAAPTNDPAYGPLLLAQHVREQCPEQCPDNTIDPNIFTTRRLFRTIGSCKPRDPVPFVPMVALEKDGTFSWPAFHKWLKGPGKQQFATYFVSVGDADETEPNWDMEGPATPSRSAAPRASSGSADLPHGNKTVDTLPAAVLKALDDYHFGDDPHPLLHYATDVSELQSGITVIHLRTMPCGHVGRQHNSKGYGGHPWNYPTVTFKPREGSLTLGCKHQGCKSWTVSVPMAPETPQQLFAGLKTPDSAAVEAPDSPVQPGPEDAAKGATAAAAIQAAAEPPYEAWGSKEEYEAEMAGNEAWEALQAAEACAEPEPEAEAVSEVKQRYMDCMKPLDIDKLRNMNPDAVLAAANAQRAYLLEKGEQPDPHDDDYRNVPYDGEGTAGQRNCEVDLRQVFQHYGGNGQIGVEADALAERMAQRHFEMTTARIDSQQGDYIFIEEQPTEFNKTEEGFVTVNTLNHALLEMNESQFCKRLKKMSFCKLVLKVVKNELKAVPERVDPATWLTWRRNPRNAFARIDCVPVCEAEVGTLLEGHSYYNTYRGLAILKADADAYYAANPAQCAADQQFIYSHVQDVLCGGEANKQECAEFVIKCVAQMIQTPWFKLKVSIIFRSLAEGLGKTQFLRMIAYVIGPRHAALTADPNLIVGSFNDLLKNKIFVGLDEAQKRTRPDAHQKMQDTVTATDMQLHGKNDKPIAMTSYVNIFQATNVANDNIVSQNQGGRRYWGVQADDDFAPTNQHDEEKVAYFVRLNRMVETREGLLAFAHMLYNIDLSTFQPWDKSQRPKTRLNTEQQGMTQTTVQRFWRAVMERGWVYEQYPSGSYIADGPKTDADYEMVEYGRDGDERRGAPKQPHSVGWCSDIGNAQDWLNRDFIYRSYKDYCDANLREGGKSTAVTVDVFWSTKGTGTNYVLGDPDKGAQKLLMYPTKSRVHYPKDLAPAQRASSTKIRPMVLTVPLTQMRKLFNEMCQRRGLPLLEVLQRAPEPEQLEQPEQPLFAGLPTAAMEPEPETMEPEPQPEPMKLSECVTEQEIEELAEE